MTMTINGSGTITGLTAGGLPDATVQPADLSTGGPYWDTSGNVGIGTNSPTVKLDANGDIRSTNDSSNQSRVGFGQYGSPGTSYSFIQGDARSTGFLAFWTSATERARIDSSGNLLVGTTSEQNGQNARLAVYPTSTGSQCVGAVSPNSFTGIHANLSSLTAAGTGWYHLVGQSGNGTTVTTNNILIYGNGNIQNANNSYGAISDLKLKENVSDASPKLEQLCQVRVVNYNLIGGYEHHKQIGVIAQELEQVFPSLVEETPDRDAEGKDLGTVTKSVKYSVFVPILIKAIQEQQAIINAQQATLTQLQADVAALKGQA